MGYLLGNVAVVGKSGAGKSYLVQHQLIPTLHRIVVWDQLREHPGLVVNSASALGRVLERDKKQWEEKHFWGSLQVAIRHEGEVSPKAFEVYAQVLMTKAWNAAVILEEVHQIIRQPMEPWANRLVYQGRHRGLQVVSTAKRPVKVALDLRSETRFWYVFWTKTPKDLKYLSEFMDPEDVAAILALPPKHKAHFVDLESTGAPKDFLEELNTKSEDI